MDEKNIVNENDLEAMKQEAAKQVFDNLPRVNISSLKTHGSRFARLFFNKDGTPVHKEVPKERMSKKERRRRRKSITRDTKG
jgi:hypothetical protein